MSAEARYYHVALRFEKLIMLRHGVAAIYIMHLVTVSYNQNKSYNEKTNNLRQLNMTAKISHKACLNMRKTSRPADLFSLGICHALSEKLT